MTHGRIVNNFSNTIYLFLKIEDPDAAGYKFEWIKGITGNGSTSGCVQDNPSNNWIFTGGSCLAPFGGGSGVTWLPLNSIPGNTSLSDNWEFSLQFVQSWQQSGQNAISGSNVNVELYYDEDMTGDSPTLMPID
jgi:hypothetical protein